MLTSLLVDGGLFTIVGVLMFGILAVSAATLIMFTNSRSSKTFSRSLPYLLSLIPIVGNSLAFARHLDCYHEWLTGHSLERDGKPFALRLLGKNDIMYVSKPEHFDEVLKTHSSNFSKSDSVRDIFDDFLGEDIVLINGERWQLHRKILANLISTRALRDYMTPIIREKVLELQNVLKQKSKINRPFDIYKLIRQFTLDTFVEIGFGCKLGLLASGKEHPFELAFDDANCISMERLIKPTWLWKCQRFLGIGHERRLREAISEMNAFIVNLIMEAMEMIKNVKTEQADESPPSKNIMAILLNTKETISPTLARDIALTGLEAGRNTTADTLAWLFHALSHNPKVLSKLRNEILTKIPEIGKSESYAPLYEDVQELSYMEATIREVFRLYPTVPVIPYHCHRDTLLHDETFVPAGTDVFLHLFAAGRQSSVWGPDVMSFKPERFIDEQTGKVLKDTKYSAFSSGTRVCLGRNLAMLELKITIAVIISRFQLREVPGQDVRPILDLTLTMKNPLMMNVELID
ncbi:unnamed protein product [Phytophthora lilii]|uniref:Unnamed protein product n=1 Tax=Phytophthora lilii TaxID=2077276 RepID=A0A9W6TN17_9STRA|nr:unnamed protein product [Phytophthora lilii]